MFKKIINFFKKKKEQIKRKSKFLYYDWELNQYILVKSAKKLDIEPDTWFYLGEEEVL